MGGLNIVCNKKDLSRIIMISQEQRGNIASPRAFQSFTIILLLGLCDWKPKGKPRFLPSYIGKTNYKWKKFSNFEGRRADEGINWKMSHMHESSTNIWENFNLLSSDWTYESVRPRIVILSIPIESVGLSDSSGLSCEDIFGVTLWVSCISPGTIVCSVYYVHGFHRNNVNPDPDLLQFCGALSLYGLVSRMCAYPNRYCFMQCFSR